MEIKKIEIDNEIVYLKKNSAFGYRIVHPIQKDISIPIYDKEKKKINWSNVNWFNLLTGGSWWNLLIIAIIVLIITGFLYEYTSNIERFMNCFENPIALENCKMAYSPKINMNFIIP